MITDLFLPHAVWVFCVMMPPFAEGPRHQNDAMIHDNTGLLGANQDLLLLHPLLY